MSNTKERQGNKACTIMLHILTSQRYYFNMWFRQGDKWKGSWLGCHCLVKQNTVHCTCKFKLNLLGESTRTTIKTARCAKIIIKLSLGESLSLSLSLTLPSLPLYLSFLSLLISFQDKQEDMCMVTCRYP